MRISDWSSDVCSSDLRAAIIRTAVESSQPLIDSLGHRLDTKLPPQPIYLHADPVRVAQIVSNLLNNAAKYTPGGGHIVLAVRAEGGQIAIEEIGRASCRERVCQYV